MVKNDGFLNLNKKPQLCGALDNLTKIIALQLFY